MILITEMDSDLLTTPKGRKIPYLRDVLCNKITNHNGRENRVQTNKQMQRKKRYFM